jgi:putative ABC transport system permease protein
MESFLGQLRYTIGGLLARKGRSFLTILGIIIGVAGVIIIISLGTGAQALVLGQITKLGTNLVNILPGKSNESGPPASVFGVKVTTLSMRDVEAIRDRSRAPHVEAITPVVQGSVTAVFGKRSIDTQVTGVEGNYPAIQNAPVSLGRFFTEEESTGEQNVAVIGATVREELFGDSNPIGEVIKVKNVPFRIIGVQDNLGTVFFQDLDDQIFVPFGIAQRQIIGITYLQNALVKINSSENIKSSISDIQTILREEHKIRSAEEDDFSVRDLADALKILTSITDVLRMFLALMAGISLIVGGIGIMNIMLVTVSERTREIGLRKALGATRKTIRNQFLLEASTLTLTGGMLGVVAGVIISFIIALGAQAFGFDWKFAISPVAILLAVGVSVVIGVTFGLYPANKASKLDPIVALRYE